MHLAFSTAAIQRTATAPLIAMSLYRVAPTPASCAK